MLCGKTYLMPHPRTQIQHLYIVICHSANKDEEVLMVNITTARNNIDQEKCCCLNVGDHTFVNHESVINYEDALCPKGGEILEAVNNGIIVAHDDVSAVLLQRIQDGAKISEAIQNKMKKFFEKF